FYDVYIEAGYLQNLVNRVEDASQADYLPQGIEDMSARVAFPPELAWLSATVLSHNSSDSSQVATNSELITILVNEFKAHTKETVPKAHFGLSDMTEKDCSAVVDA